MHGSLACSRLGCDEPAVAVFAFDARECLVWLDPLGAGRGAGVLCARHADRMSPPRGWNLLDRRTAEARLWIGVTPEVEHSPRPRERTTRRRTSPPGSRLPFDVPAAADVPAARLPDATPVPVTATTTTARAGWSPREEPGPDLEHVLDARTPLLARAFEGARATEAGR